MEAMGLGAPESGSLLQVERAQKEAQRQRQREEDEDTAMTTNGADDDAPVLSIAKEKILEEVRAKEKTEKPVLSLVVVGESSRSCGSALISSKAHTDAHRVNRSCRRRQVDLDGTGPARPRRNFGQGDPQLPAAE